MKTDIDGIGDRLDHIEDKQDKFATEMKAAAEVLTNNQNFYNLQVLDSSKSHFHLF